MFALSRRVFILRIAFALILVLAIALPAADLVAQDEEEGQDGQEEPEGLDELKEERERVAREAALAAQNIDVRTATVEEVTRALDEIAEFVAIQELRLGEAEASHQSLVDAVNRAEDEREAILVEAELIREQLADLAVRSFTGESGARAMMSPNSSCPMTPVSRLASCTCSNCRPATSVMGSIACVDSNLKLTRWLANRRKQHREPQRAWVRSRNVARS